MILWKFRWWHWLCDSSSPSTLHIYTPLSSSLCPMFVTLSFSHSRTRGVLAHSSSTPVDSTTIQSRSTRHAVSFAEYASALRCLFLSFIRLCFSSVFSRISIWSSSSYCIYSLLHFLTLFSSLGLISFRSSSFFKKDNAVLLKEQRDFYLTHKLKESEPGFVWYISMVKERKKKTKHCVDGREK